MPVAVDTTGLLSGKTVKSIDVGFAQTCVVASDNHAYCWGDNTMGQLGDGTTNESDVPVAVSTTGIMSGKTILTIAAHQSNHTCAIASDNLAYCWGNNWSGQLGNDQDHQFVNTAITAVDMTGVLSGMTIKSLYAVVNHTCAIASDDNAYCWGQNDSGNIGNGNNNSYSYPVAVYTGGALSGRTIKSIASGWSHVCAIASDDNSYCWGQNQGAFGNGDGMNSFYPVHTFAAP